MDSENSTSPEKHQNIFQFHSSEKHIFTHNLGPGHEKYGLHSIENIYFGGCDTPQIYLV